MQVKKSEKLISHKRRVGSEAVSGGAYVPKYLLGITHSVLKVFAKLTLFSASLQFMPFIFPDFNRT